MLVLFYTILVIVASIIIYFIQGYNKNKEYWKKLDDFYTIKALPFFGNAYHFKNEEDFLWITHEVCKQAEYKTYRLSIGNTTYVNLCEPETVEALLSSNKEIIKMDDYGLLKEWLGEGLLISTGNKWRQRRKIITPTFHFKILEQFVKVFNDNGKILIEQLSKETGKVIDIYPFINSYALDVICESAMGVQVHAQTDKNSSYVKAIRSICVIIKAKSFSPLKFVPWLHKYAGNQTQYSKDIKVIHSMTNSVIKTRKELLKDQIEKVKNGEVTGNMEDDFFGKRKKVAFLDLLLLSKLPDGSFLSDEDVREETDTFMFEGHDTTASGISFTLYCLANNSGVQEKALEEIISIIGDDPNTEITYQHLQDMKYLEMVIKESLRLYPPVPIIGRKLEKDFTLPDGKIAPKGCQITVDVFSLGRNPHSYDDPLKYDPNRFLQENTTGKNPFHYVPFSAGPRNCVGQRFALLELKCVIAKILLNFDLQSAGENHSVRLTSELILKTVDGVKIILNHRKKQAH